jgi:proline iminopeptidase
MKAADPAASRERFHMTKQSAGNALALMGGMDIEHVDMPIGFEVGEPGQPAVGYRHKCGFIGASAAKAFGIDVVGRPGPHLFMGIVAPRHPADGIPEQVYEPIPVLGPVWSYIYPHHRSCLSRWCQSGVASIRQFFQTETMQSMAPVGVAPCDTFGLTGLGGTAEGGGGEIAEQKRMGDVDLYPEIEPFDSGMLDLDGRHKMYWEQAGNPKGMPVVFLHGGPGSGASPAHRRFFDPAHYRIVVFDQRGAGRSKPLGETIDNTTQHLVGDIERLRQFVGVEGWHVFGGSWGSTLALAYAQAHPGRVLSLALRGIFLCRKKEIDWFLHGMGWLAPEIARDFVEFLPAAERGDLMASYHRRIMNPDPKIHLPAARMWSVYEGTCCTLLPNPELMATFNNDGVALSVARLECHYFMNGIFMPENALLDNLHRIRKIPAAIVQGRYDLVCPIASADELHRAWPEAAYEVIPDAGHSVMEPGIRKALVRVMNDFRKIGREVESRDRLSAE